MSDTTVLRATCKAQEWQRDGRGLWAMRACRLEPDHGNRHEFSPWRYNVDVREAIAALAPPADRAAAAPAPEGLDGNRLADWASYRLRPTCDCHECEDGKQQVLAALRARPALSDETLRALVDALLARHYGRMPDEVQAAVDAVQTELAAAPAPQTDHATARAKVQEWLREDAAAQAPEGLAARLTAQADRWERRVTYLVPPVEHFIGVAERMRVREPKVQVAALSDETLREMAKRHIQQINLMGGERIEFLITFARAVLARQQEQG